MNETELHDRQLKIRFLPLSICPMKVNAIDEPEGSASAGTSRKWTFRFVAIVFSSCLPDQLSKVQRMAAGVSTSIRSL